MTRPKNNPFFRAIKQCMYFEVVEQNTLYYTSKHVFCFKATPFVIIKCLVQCVISKHENKSFSIIEPH